MRIRFVVLVFLSGLLAVGVIRTASKVQNKELPIKGRLQWFAKEAKNEGRQKVTIPAPITEYAGSAATISLDEASSSSTVVVAHLVEKRSYQEDGNNVVTWNKFMIDEVFTEAKELPCPACLPPNPPAEMLPLQSGEFLIPKSGGRMTVDGVEIEQLDFRFPEFYQSHRYLLLLQLYPSGVASIAGGPVGVFTVDKNGKALPLTESEHRLRKDFQEKYGNSLDQLRKHLKSASW